MIQIAGLHKDTWGTPLFCFDPEAMETAQDAGNGGVGQAGNVTPTRGVSTAGTAESPAGKRAKVAKLAEPVYDSAEHYNHEELVAQVKRMKAEFKVAREATVDVLEKHNNVV